ncbi:hypothetical protein E2C01_052470 [Portunus trituberculatus]|uniref:Uncharacterized protein n=1 Tax=Portunus trituberculatus TaxID=210409 RepID=A0A5B7GLZ2_PORTR|nr:hypothetical protein [Portunus trituberculatus]
MQLRWVSAVARQFSLAVNSPCDEVESKLFESFPVIEVVDTFNPAGERSLQGLYFHDVSYFVRRPELAAIFHTGQHQRLPK